MDFVNRKDAIKRIMRNVMHALDFQSVQSFADALGVNYMQVYYAYNGTITAISQNVIDSILKNFPEVNKTYLIKGEGPVLNTSSNETENELEERPVTNDDMFRLLDRVTLLLEKMQAREEYIIHREKVLDEMIAKLSDVIENKTELLSDNNE